MRRQHVVCTRCPQRHRCMSPHSPRSRSKNRPVQTPHWSSHAALPPALSRCSCVVNVARIPHSRPTAKEDAAEMGEQLRVPEPSPPVRPAPVSTVPGVPSAPTSPGRAGQIGQPVAQSPEGIRPRLHAMCTRCPQAQRQGAFLPVSLPISSWQAQQRSSRVGTPPGSRRRPVCMLRRSLRCVAAGRAPWGRVKKHTHPPAWR